ncbi:MAG: hypothetical protein Kow0079_15200 [Vicingaceae bacterium]
MKKFVLSAVVVFSLNTYAQKSKVQSAYNYNKAFERSQNCKELVNGLEAINAAIENETTKGDAKTWYYRGNLYFNVLASKDKCTNIDKEALDKCTDSYMKALVLNFKDESLRKLDLEKQEDVMKFFNALQSKAPVDDQMYTMDIIGRRFPGLAGEYGNKGITEFQNKNYKAAKEYFSKSLVISQMTGKIDTVMMYNTALAAEYEGDKETAKQIYQGLIMLKYNIDGAGPGLYQSLAKIYKEEGDTAKALQIIQDGRKAYPGDKNLIVEEVDFYLQSGKTEEALNGLKLAIEKDPSNPVLYFAQGTLYEQAKNGDKAIESYKKAIELKPDYYDALFNLGAYYFNHGADLVNEANALPPSDTKGFNALNDQATENFKMAIPYVEKANQINPNDIDVANMLIKLYTRTGEYQKAKDLKAKYQ